MQWRKCLPDGKGRTTKFFAAASMRRSDACRNAAFMRQQGTWKKPVQHPTVAVLMLGSAVPDFFYKWCSMLFRYRRSLLPWRRNAKASRSDLYSSEAVLVYPFRDSEIDFGVDSAHAGLVSVKNGGVGVRVTELSAKQNQKTFRITARAAFPHLVLLAKPPGSL